QIREAEKSGVAAAVLYHDPFDDPGDPLVLANGERLPGDAVERGSLKTYPGDPGTPYLPATEDVYMPPGSDSRLLDLPSIPVQPISFNDAQELLSGMSGSMAPLEWQGKLNITYNLGPGCSSGEDTQVQLSVHNILRRADIHNVIGGTLERASSPAIFPVMSGRKAGITGKTCAGQTEHVRMPGNVAKIGANPVKQCRRARNLDWIVLAEPHWILTVARRKQKLFQKPIRLQICSPCRSLAQLFPLGAARGRQVEIYQNGANGPTGPLLFPAKYGGGYSPKFSGKMLMSQNGRASSPLKISDYPAYHTAYDTYEAVANHTDPGLHSLATVVKVVGMVLLKLLDSLQLPMHAGDYADQIRRDYATFEGSYAPVLEDHAIDLEPVTKALVQFEQAASSFHDNYEGMNKNNLLLALQEYNDRLVQLERAFLLPSGYPHHPHFRHVIYGPSSDGSYQGVLFPHLRAAIEDAKRDNHSASWNQVRESLSYVVHALRSAANVLNSTVLTKHDAH
ncbi:unnamed protein product, partial [Ixodes pacificus]